MNRLQSSAIKGKIPCEVLFSKPPSLSHFRVIGCLCYASMLLKGDKISKKAKPIFLIGYSTTRKRYFLLDLTINKLFVTMDIVF